MIAQALSLVRAVGLTMCWFLAVWTAAAAPFEAGRWIAPPSGLLTNAAPPVFRKEFTLERKPKQVVLRLIGLGDYDVRINGRRLATTGLNQPWSQYEKTLYYRDYDVTALMGVGANCVGVTLGNAFWHNPDPPAGRYNKHGPQRQADEPFLLRAEIQVVDKRGQAQTLGTDASWRVSTGPITFSHIFAGEDYDVGLAQAGWDQPGYEDRAWAAARLAAEPTGQLVPQNFPGIQECSRQAPLAIHEPAPGVFLYAFPQNMAAQLRVELAGGAPGARVGFRCGEHKNDQNRLFGGYTVSCHVVTDGRPLSNQWTFFYLGMQFVEVTGAVPEGRPNPQGLPVVRKMEMVEVRAGLPETGAFRCSSELYNRTHRLIDWAMRANTTWVLSDCPHREKLGWLECAYLLEPTFLYRYEGRTWFEKICRDMRDAQLPNGRVLTVAPSYPAGRFPAAFDWTAEWGAAAVLTPWQHYEWFGDRRTLEDNFDMMRRLVDCLGAESKDGLAPGGLGDWYDYGHGKPPGPSRFTPVQLSATAIWGQCAQKVAEAAEVLGRTDDARAYRALHARIAQDFQRHYLDPATRRLRHKGSPQCANAMALCGDLVPAADRAGLVADIVADLEKRGWQQTPGDIGHVFFIRALAEAGRSDVLHRVYSREGLGSYGGILAKGLTSMPETWDAMMDGVQSLNHCMLGHVIEWQYGYVAGIRQAPGSVGWREVLIAPVPGSLTEAEGKMLTPLGPVACHWWKQDGQFRLEVQVPKGMKAAAVLPSGRREVLRAGKQTLREKL